MKMLWQGARGPAVKKLQARLRELSFNPGIIDGIFGIRTKSAVIAFQRSQALSADGIAGPHTLNALNLSTASPGTLTRQRTKVFVSYSHADRKWLQMLQVHIAPLERSGIVVLWDDTRIASGQKWREEIGDAIQSAKVAVLLISANFMASKFIAENELPPLLRAAENEGARILPVIISPCIMGNISHLQAVNSSSRPMVDLNRGCRDRVWVRLVNEITVALNQ